MATAFFITLLTSTSFIAPFDGLEKSRSRLTMLSIRIISFSSLSVISIASLLSVPFLRMPTYPSNAPRGFPISWAIPAESLPTVASFSDLINPSCMAVSSLLSLSSVFIFSSSLSVIMLKDEAKLPISLDAFILTLCSSLPLAMLSAVSLRIAMGLIMPLEKRYMPSAIIMRESKKA